MRRNNPIVLALFVRGVLFSATAAADVPTHIYWTAEPVLPGQTAMLQGSGWDEQTKIILSEAESGNRREVPILDVNPRSLRFVIPEDMPPDVYSCALTTAAGETSLMLNAPQPWWWQAGAGRQATPGGWIRSFGRCLELQADPRGAIADSSGNVSTPTPPTPRMELRNANRQIALALDETTPWSLGAQLPPDLATGSYGLWVHNGHGGEAAWVEAGKVEVVPARSWWPEKVFAIVDFGATADDASDDSEALRAALAAVAENGGGMVRFPQGRFRFSGGFELPPRVLLQGAGNALTHLCWADMDEPPEALLSSTEGKLGVEDLSLYAFNYQVGIRVAAPKPQSGSGTTAPRASGVRIRRVNVRFTPLSLKTLPPEQRAARLVTLRRAVVFDVRADDVQVEDCDLAWTTGRGFSVQGSDTVCRRITAYAERGGWCPVGGGRRIICEHNRFFGNTTGATRGGELWFAHNRVAHQYAGFREGFTTDGTFGGVGFLKDVEVDGCEIRFTADAGRTEPSHIPAAVRVVEGTGAGQFRRIVSQEHGRLIIDRPLDVTPDETSVLWAANMMHRHIFYNNDVADTGIALQLFGAALDCVVANNRSTRSGGFRVWGNNLAWYVQMVGNRIVEGYGTEGPESRGGISAVHVVGPYVRGFKGVTVRGMLIRDNLIENHATIELRGAIDDATIEHNLVQNSPRGMVADLWQRQHGIVLRGNRFENVAEPFYPAEARQRYRFVDGP